MATNTFDFIGGDRGTWKLIRTQTILGPSLENVAYIDILPSIPGGPTKGVWTLTGFTSNVRYAEKEEKAKLTAIQADLGRTEATCAALIPIRKTDAWWNLAQDERRKIFETDSHHTAIGLKYLPAIARKLYHCRDLGQAFDFLTWFEYAPEDADKFEELVNRLRETEEWQYVDREIDFRLVKA
jgi:chlorite dismutase